MSVVRWLRISIGRLRQGWLLVVESTAAATVAWLVDTRFIGHPQPFFAPAATLIVLAQVRGQRTRRAIETQIDPAPTASANGSPPRDTAFPRSR